MKLMKATITIACIAAGACTGANGASKGITLPSLPAPTAGELKQKLDLQDIPYIQDDTFISNPLGLLGQVVEVRKNTDKCPASWQTGAVEFSVIPLSGWKVDAKSVLTAPTKRDSKVITKDVAASLSFLSFLSAQMTADDVISAILFDQAAGRVDDKDATWAKAVKDWEHDHADLYKDASVCYLAVVRGVIQKNLVRRTFQSVGGQAAGGVYGVNVNGKYHSSSEDYSVDVRFGLSVGILKRPPSPQGFDAMGGRIEDAPTQEEVDGAMTISQIRHKTH